MYHESWLEGLIQHLSAQSCNPLTKSPLQSEQKKPTLPSLMPACYTVQVGSTLSSSSLASSSSSSIIVSSSSNYISMIYLYVLITSLYQISLEISIFSDYNTLNSNDVFN